MLKLPILALVIALTPALTHAHAVVTDNTLKIEPVKAGQARQIALIFNSQVELGLSQFNLIKQGDIREPLAIKPGRERGQVLIELPALLPGEHAVQLKVFAADGHLTEDIIRFNVVE